MPFRIVWHLYCTNIFFHLKNIRNVDMTSLLRGDPDLTISLIFHVITLNSTWNGNIWLHVSVAILWFRRAEADHGTVQGAEEESQEGPEEDQQRRRSCC
mmetsp:Transcript_2552/g.5394  ORF Transcript_2552/g.5394 Transcript_2552/m.5394 type:complete len:99 (-) Transcript_2552:238-534(-)